MASPSEGRTKTGSRACSKRGVVMTPFSVFSQTRRGHPTLSTTDSIRGSFPAGRILSTNRGKLPNDGSDLDGPASVL